LLPDPSADAGEQRELLARLRAVIEARDAENAVLRAELDAALERYRRLELRVAELERRLGQDSIVAKQRRKAGRWQRQESERERRGDRKRGGQPGHQGKGLGLDPDPGERKEAGPSAECRNCKARLDGAAAAGSRWAQVIDVEVIRTVTEWLLPGLACPCCGTVTFAGPPPGAHPGSVCYGAVLNAAGRAVRG
jgi:transposase